MRVLGRELAPPFDTFWKEFGPEIGVPPELIEEGHSAVFGALGADLTAPAEPEWAALPDADLAYHVAHELAHVALRQRGFPHTGRGDGYPADSAEARIGGDVEEMALHPALDALILPLGFTKDVIRRRMLNGAMNGVANSPAPGRGTPWFYTWAIRFCELRIELPADLWRPLERLYETRSPEVCELGRELAAIMEDVGWGTREQALQAMIAVRDTLGLGVDDRVLVIDPVSGGRF